MKHYDKTYNIFSASGPAEPATFSCQRIRVDCFHCGRETVFAVPPAYVDWERVADDYKRVCERLMTGYSNVMHDMEVIYGEDNPGAVYYRNQIKMLLLEAKKHFGQ